MTVWGGVDACSIRTAVVRSSRVASDVKRYSIQSRVDHAMLAEVMPKTHCTRSIGTPGSLHVIPHLAESVFIWSATSNAELWEPDGMENLGDLLCTFERLSQQVNSVFSRRPAPTTPHLFKANGLENVVDSLCCSGMTM